MRILNTAHVNCPACGEQIAVPVRLKALEGVYDGLINVEYNVEQVQHVCQGEQ